MRYISTPTEYFILSGHTYDVYKQVRKHVDKEHYYVTAGSLYVHTLAVVRVANIVYTLTGEIDCSELPDVLHGHIEGKKKVWKGPSISPKPIEVSDPYKVLHLLPDAPIELVKVVWKHLAARHHPDAGGSKEQFELVTEAYNTITRGKHVY